MYISLHHYSRKSRKSRRNARIIDFFVYCMALFGFAANLPQLWNVWFDRNITGVSIFSWVCFLIISIFWLLYGIIHKAKPIILANSLLILAQSTIVIGMIARG